MTIHAESPFHSAPTSGATMAAISNDLVRLLARSYGHGPTKARTLLVEDVLVSRMFDPFTVAERTLLSRGRADVVRAMRSSFNDCMRAQLEAIVERHTGRTVVGFIGDTEVRANLVALVFFLAPD